jgi:hypothetical protein
MLATIESWISQPPASSTRQPPSLAAASSASSPLTSTPPSPTSPSSPPPSTPTPAGLAPASAPAPTGSPSTPASTSTPPPTSSASATPSPTSPSSARPSPPASSPSTRCERNCRRIAGLRTPRSRPTVRILATAERAAATPRWPGVRRAQARRPAAGTRARSSASTSTAAVWILLPLCVPRKRRSGAASVRPRQAGCFWNLRNDSSSPAASRTRSTVGTPSARMSSSSRSATHT